MSGRRTWFSRGKVRSLLLGMIIVSASVSMSEPTRAQAFYTYDVIEVATGGTAYLPTINAAGQVAYVTGGRVRRGGDGAPPVTINIAAPLATGEVTMNAQGVVAFTAALSIWKGDGLGPATLVAQWTSTYPALRQPSINNHDQIVFVALPLSGGSRIVTGSALSPVVSPGDPTPSGFVVQAGTPAINNNGQIGFSAQVNPGGFGIFRKTGSHVDHAGTASNVGSYGFSMNDSGLVAYYDGVRAIRTNEGRTIAEPADGVFIEPHRVSINNSDMVAFMGTTTISAAADRVMVGYGGIPRTVLRIDETLSGLGRVTGLAIGNFSLNDAGQVAMLVSYHDGQSDKLAIVRATPAGDTLAPQLDVPDPIVVAATGPEGARVPFAVTAIDVADPNPVVECTHESGTTFPIGTTIVECTATDDSANSASASFSVTVMDVIGPTIVVPAPLTIEATSAAGAVATFNVTASDPGYPDPVVTCVLASGSLFPLGTTTVVCTAADNVGNTVNASFTVTVLDRTPPVLHLPQGLSIDAFMTGVTLSYVVIATDLVDPAPVVTCTPPNGSPVSFGNNVPVTCTALDATGNVSSGVFTVTVLSLADLLSRLIDEVIDLRLNSGLTTSLLLHLGWATERVETISNRRYQAQICPHLRSASSQLAAGVHMGQITSGQAAPLLQRLADFQSYLGCWNQLVLR